MHKMGRKLTTLLFHSRWRFSDGQAGSTGFSGPDEHQKIFEGCMHERAGGKNFISGIAEH